MVQANITHSTRDGNVTFYNIRVCEGDHHWTVQRRYNDFVALERQIKSSDGKSPDPDASVRVSQDMQRRQGLEQYLSHLIGQIAELSQNAALRDFLAPDSSGAPTPAGTLKRAAGPVAPRLFRFADAPGEHSIPMLGLEEMERALRRSDSCPCVLQYMRPPSRSPGRRSSASRALMTKASTLGARRSSSRNRRLSSTQRTSTSRVSRPSAPALLDMGPAQQFSAHGAEASAMSDHDSSDNSLEEFHEEYAVLGNDELAQEAESDTGEPWSVFLTRATQKCAAVGLKDEPSSLFETFRTTADLGVAYASFSRLFHVATASQSQGGRRMSSNLTVDPPWVTDAPGRQWRYPYEPVRLLLGGNWKAKKLWTLLDKRCGRAEYSPSCAADAPCGSNSRLGETGRCLVVGAGPCGLRAAIELRLLGARVTIIERRQDFSRINQLHLWSWLGEELKQLGARCLEPPPSDWGTDANMLHISINHLQTLLFKMALLLGVQVLFGVEYVKSEWNGRMWCACLREFKGRSAKEGRAVAAGIPSIVQEGELPISPRPPVMLQNVAVLLGANGFTSSIGEDAGMKSLETDHMKSESAIGLIVNFSRTRGKAESRLHSFSIARQFYMPLFKRCAEETGAELENIVYTKGSSSNYFVMTPTRRCLIDTGVVIDAARSPSLDRDNLDLAKLDALVRRIVAFPFKAEGSIYAALVEDLKREGLTPSYADSGPALFDFSKMKRSAEGLLFVEAPRRSPNSVSSRGSDGSSSNSDDEDGHDEDLLVALVGDSLIEPFWPEGLGISRGFFGVWDVCAAVAEWTSGQGAQRVMQIFQEAYVQLKSLGAATRARVLVDKESAFALKPKTRYRVFDPNRRRASYAAGAARQRRSTFAFDVTSFARQSLVASLQSQPSSVGTSVARVRSQTFASADAGQEAELHNQQSAPSVDSIHLKLPQRTTKEASSIEVPNQRSSPESQHDALADPQPPTKQDVSAGKDVREGTGVAIDVPLVLVSHKRSGRRRVTIAAGTPMEKVEVLEDQVREERRAHHRERLSLQQQLASLESQLSDANCGHELASETYALFAEAQRWRAEAESLRARAAGRDADEE